MSAASTEQRRGKSARSTKMATTSSTLAAGKAIPGQGGNGKHGRRGLRAKLAAGVVTLGCAAGLILGGLHVGDAARVQPRAATQGAPQTVAAPGDVPQDCMQGNALSLCGDFSGG